MLILPFVSECGGVEEMRFKFERVVKLGYPRNGRCEARYSDPSTKRFMNFASRFGSGIAPAL